MYKNCYYVSERKAEDAHLKNATNKARADVEFTLAELGMKEVKIALEFQGDNASIAASLQEHWNTYKVWKKTLAHLGKGDLLVVQFPSISHCIFLGKLFKELRGRGVTVVLLIHDLEKLRFIEAEVPFKTRVRQSLDESSVLKAADLVIAHNPVMIDYLVGEGVAREKLVSLDIFDYRMPADFEPHKPYAETDETNLDAPGADLIIAGNLDSDKVGYLKDIGRVPGVRFQLYGVGYKDESSNAVYNGSFLPDELPRQLRHVPQVQRPAQDVPVPHVRLPGRRVGQVRHLDVRPGARRRHRRLVAPGGRRRHRVPRPVRVRADVQKRRRGLRRPALRPLPEDGGRRMHAAAGPLRPRTRNTLFWSCL